MSAK
jgi:hypothetical protein